MSPVPSRYIRAIYLLPGVKCESQAKREKGCFASSGKKKGQLLVWFIKGSANVRCAYCIVNWSHAVLYCCFTVVGGGQK